ncbi:MAG TPA: YqgE/AlgH family protein [Afifellaceae bacterium]|nr:YqgE/AlgH family protein [Afifellaceae bacterium]
MAQMPETDIALNGQLLIAMPGMADTRFARALVYMCAHSADEGAMGIVVNQPEPDLNMRDLLVQLNIVPDAHSAQLANKVDEIRVHRGGPVESGRGFVLHSADFMLNDASLRVGKNIGLTSTLEILRAIASGSGPQEAIFALGYAGWAPGQLETEIVSNGWLHAPADEAILFDANIDTKYDRALAKLGIAPAMLSADAGHA